nr:hypothetical protein [Mycoplasmopsis bovis]
MSADTPTEVKKGQIIGFLGTQDTNGGWMAHAHVNLYTNRNFWLSPNHFNKESKQSNIDKRVKDYKKTNKGKIKIHTSVAILVLKVCQIKPVVEVDPKTGEAKKTKVKKMEKKKTNEINH